MASFFNHFPFFLLLITLLSLLHKSTHARSVEFFNKASATNNVNIPNNKEPQTTQPEFLPENENSYGLYGHESGQLPPSATTNQREPSDATTAAPLNKHLPKNYNPVAYITEPDNTATFTEENSFKSNPEINHNNNYYNGAAENYYNNQQETEYRSRGKRNNYYYYNGGGSSFNSNPQRFGGGSSFNSNPQRFGGGYEPQGMSDTRSLENGKYFYDVNTEKYSTNHPYESMKGVSHARNEYNNRNYYANNENTYEFNGDNSMGGYQKQVDFQDEEIFNNMP